MERPLTSFPLSASLRLKLKQKGFMMVGDVLELKPTQLSKELGISNEEALETVCFLSEETQKAKVQLTNVTGSNKSHQDVGHDSSNKTVMELLQDERSQQCIITFSEQLDTILGGGVPLTKITEICGAPGIGKTQFSIQLSVDVQIPECFGGVEGQAVYIDTEGSFLVDRVVDIAEAAIKHCHHIANMEQNQEQLDRLNTFTLKSILGGIHYFRCHDYIQLLALIHTLPEFIKQHPQVSLVVLDSIAVPFRHHFEDYSLRTRLLNGLAQNFIKLAVNFKLAIFLTNQMTTKISVDQSQSSHLIPALGESWGHAATIRIILYWQQNVRYALLYKSPSHKETSVPFQITAGGIRDICQSNSGTVSMDTSLKQAELCNKRQKINCTP